jgi:hypothetical protein
MIIKNLFNINIGKKMVERYKTKIEEAKNLKSVFKDNKVSIMIILMEDEKEIRKALIDNGEEEEYINGVLDFYTHYLKGKIGFSTFDPYFTHTTQKIPSFKYFTLFQYGDEPSILWHNVSDIKDFIEFQI